MGNRVKDLILKLDESPTTTGEMIRCFRKGRGFTLNTLSEISGIAESHLSQIENDVTDLGVKKAQILAAVLGVRPQDILFPEEV